MSDHDLFLYWLTVGSELLLCVFVYRRQLRGRLPFFTTYVLLMTVGTVGLQVVYLRYGFRSQTAYSAGWSIVGVLILARTLAIVELCRHELRGFRGIWGLTWRILVALGILFLGHAAVDAWGQLDRLVIYGLTLERDIQLSSLAILLTMVLIHKYYGLLLDPVYKWILVGLAITSVVDVMNNTVLRDTFSGALSSWFHPASASSWSEMRPQIEHANDVWNAIRTSGLVVSISVWCFALRKPLPAAAPAPVMLPDEVYRELSPAVNLRLRAFNSRLMELLKS